MLFFLGLQKAVLATASWIAKKVIIMGGIIVVFLVLTKQVSSSNDICNWEGSQIGDGLVFLKLTLVLIQGLGICVIVILISIYHFFTVHSKFVPEIKDWESLDTEFKVKTPSLPEWITCVGVVRLEQSGVKVLTTNDKIPGKQQDMSRDLKLLLESPSNHYSEILAEDELLLSPVIRLTASRLWLNGKLEVHIPHVANMTLSFPTWNIILKELGRNGKWQAMYQSDRDGIWKLVSGSNHVQSFVDHGQNGNWKAMMQSDENGIWEFVSESNHVKFFTDHISSFVIVGRYDRSSISLFKCMKIAAFCGEPKGNCLSVKIYFFDDCDWSYERVISKEKMESRRLVSSIESLTFSVTSEDDIAINIKDIEGCQLDESVSQLRVSHKSLKNSFTEFPVCELQFYSCYPGKVGFLGILGFTQSCFGETAMCVHVPVDKERFAEKMVERSIKQMGMKMDPSGNYKDSDTYQGNQMVTEQGAYRSKLLKSLVHDHSDFVEKIFRRLDTRIQGAGHYEVVANFFLGFDHFDVRSTLETSVGGPSRAMIEAIVTRHPKLTVEIFARVVEKRAGRKDVANLLREYDRDSLKGSI